MPDAIAALPTALHVTRNFPPLVGGMENVNARLLEALSATHRVGLCGPAGCAAHAARAVLVLETPVRPLWRFVSGMGCNAIVAALRLRPKLVLAGSGLAAPMAWFGARLVGARLAVYLHGLDVIVDDALYQRAWLPFIRACDLVLVNSRNTAELAIGRGIKASRIHVLHPGTDVSEMDPRGASEEREALGVGSRPVLLSVGRLTRRKGLGEFVQRALPAIAAQRPDVLLLIVGGEALDALSGGGTGETARILDLARAAGLADNVRFLGRCDDARLSRLYQAADLHVFPILDLPGDVEGFGMVALESAAHGLRTAGFSVGGVPDAVETGVTGVLVAPGDYASLADAVLALLQSPATSDERAASREFAAGKDWRQFGRRLHSILSGAV
jgi:phosphatidylinositol alpha-1,6-mannosyltransferase